MFNAVFQKATVNAIIYWDNKGYICTPYSVASQVSLPVSRSNPSPSVARVRGAICIIVGHGGCKAVLGFVGAEKNELL